MRNSGAEKYMLSRHGCSSVSGHIACDQTSRSEIVVPLVYQSEVVGVLDIDAPIPDRFKPADEAVLCELGAWIGELFALNPHER